MGKLDTRLGEAADRLDRSENPDDAVEATATAHGVCVRARHDGARRAGTGQAADQVGCGVHLDAEAGLLHRLGHPLPPGPVEIREDTARPSRGIGIRIRSEDLEVSRHPVEVRPDGGAHDGGVFGGP